MSEVDRVIVAKPFKAIVRSVERERLGCPKEFHLSIVATGEFDDVVLTAPAVIDSQIEVQITLSPKGMVNYVESIDMEIARLTAERDAMKRRLAGTEAESE